MLIKDNIYPFDFQIEWIKNREAVDPHFKRQNFYRRAVEAEMKRVESEEQNLKPSPKQQ